MSSPAAPSQTIAMALSGGVDSAFAAWLLRERGFRVIGLHADLGLDTPEQQDRLERLAAFLDIPLEIVPLAGPFQERVIDYLVREYRRGLTPNPCVVCNRTIKFGLLLRRALELGADGMATGHYARVLPCSEGGGLTLARGADRTKDQSYFLHRLDPQVIPRLFFPLGDLTKAEVRKRARELALPISAPAESQDACFLPPGGYRELLERETGSRPAGSGEIVDREGRVLGTHRGLYAHTVGQRRGLGLPARSPYYVLTLDVQHNRLVVGLKEELASPGLWLRDFHRLCEPSSWNGLRVTVQIRYRHRPAAGTVRIGPDRRIGVEFEVPQEAVTPGQAAVFYHEDRVLGGGWIEESWPKCSIS